MNQKVPIMNQQDMFGRILASLHDAAFDDEHWLETSALIDEACQARGNHLVFSSQSPHGVDTFFTRFCYRGDHRTDLEQEYFCKYYPNDEHLPNLRQLPDGKIVHVTQLLDEQQLGTSLTYNEIMPRFHFQDGLNIRLDGPRDSRIVWGIADPTGSGGWSSDQLAMIERLLPHIRQFVRFRQALLGAQLLGSSLTNLMDNAQVGVIHLDRHGKILAASDHARAIFHQNHGLSDKGGYLRAWLPADNARLERLLADALPNSGKAPVSGSMTVPRPPGFSALAIHVNPISARQIDFAAQDAGALVFIVDPQNRFRIDPGLLAATLSLTPAQSQVAVLLAEGKTVSQIAQATGRRENTVNTHLKQIHRKLGVSRRSELIHHIHAVAAPPHIPALISKPPSGLQKPDHATPECYRRPDPTDAWNTSPQGSTS